MISTRWYPKLVRSTSDDSRGGIYILLDNIPVEELSEYLFVARENHRKTFEYRAFHRRDIRDLLQTIYAGDISLGLVHRYFHSVSISGLPRKPYFDIDGTLDKLEPGQKLKPMGQLVIEKLVNGIERILTDLHLPFEVDRDIKIETAHKDDKFSAHIIMPRHQVADEKSAKAFFEAIMSLYQGDPVTHAIMEKFCDPSVYSKNRNFRTAYSSKRAEPDRPLIPCPTFIYEGEIHNHIQETVGDVSKLGDFENFSVLDFLESFPTFFSLTSVTSIPIPVPPEIKTSQGELPNDIEDLVAKLLLSYLHLETLPFFFSRITGHKIYTTYFQRPNATFQCPLHKRCHENVAPVIGYHATSGIFYYNCYRPEKCQGVPLGCSSRTVIPSCSSRPQQEEDENIGTTDDPLDRTTFEQIKNDINNPWSLILHPNRVDAVNKVIHQAMLKLCKKEDPKEHYLAAKLLLPAVKSVIMADSDGLVYCIDYTNPRNKKLKLTSNLAIREILNTFSDLIPGLIKAYNSSLKELRTQRKRDGETMSEKDLDELEQTIDKLQFQLTNIRKYKASCGSSPWRNNVTHEIILMVKADPTFTPKISEWMANPNGNDVNVRTGDTRRRSLLHKMTSMSIANFTYQENATDEENFGLMPEFANQMSCQNKTSFETLLKMTWHCMIGNNVFKYLLLMVGRTNGGKSTWASLLKLALGPSQYATVHKSVIVNTGKHGTSSKPTDHAGYAQVVGNKRLLIVDEFTKEDSFKADEIKLHTSGADASIVARTIWSGDIENLKITSPYLLLLNFGCMPQVSFDESLMGRFRLWLCQCQYVSQSAYDVLSDSEKASERYYVKNDEHVECLKTKESLDQFLNFIIVKGGVLIKEAHKAFGETIPFTEEMQDILESSESHKTFKCWFANVTTPEMGGLIPLDDLARVYEATEGMIKGSKAQGMSRLLSAGEPSVRTARRLCTTSDGQTGRKTCVIGYNLSVSVPRLWLAHEGEFSTPSEL